MAYILALEKGRLKIPKDLLEKLKIGPDERVSIQAENGTLVIRPIDEETDTASPVFAAEEPAPLQLDTMLREIGPEYVAEAYSDAGLLTRAEFMAILREFEEHFGLSSPEFYEKWQKGELPDRVEFTFWAHMYEESLDERIRFKDEAPLEDLVGQPPE